MSVHVIEWGRQEDVDYVTVGPTKKDYEEVVASTHAMTCEKCGAPMTKGTYRCEYCGTEYIADIVVREELKELKAKQYGLEMKVKTARLEAAMQEQTARLLELMRMNKEIWDIREEMKRL